MGFIAGFIDAIVGGGGMLTIPTLLSVGLPSHVALGTNKLAASFGSVTAAFTFYKKNYFTPSFWYHSLVSTAIGAITGTLLVHLFNAQVLGKLLPVIILLTAIYTLFSKQQKTENGQLPEKSSTNKWKQSIQGFFLGLYDGFAGPGTGAFWIVSSSFLYKINLLLSCGLARSCNFISNITSLVTFIYLGNVDFTIGLTMGAFIMIGSYIGARSAIKYGANFIRPIFTSIVIIMSINLAFQTW